MDEEEDPSEEEYQDEKLPKKVSKKASEVFRLSDLDASVSYYKTGIPEIDYTIGGLPASCICQIAGREGVGKTTLTMQAAIGAMAKLPEDKMLGYADFECRAQVKLLKYFCKINGVDESRVLLQRPANGQEGLTTVREWIDSGKFAIIVLDSAKAIIDKKSILKDVDENKAAMANARLLNDFLESILATVTYSKTSLILIDHLKSKGKIMNKFDFYETCSGVAIKFFASARWFLMSGKEGAIKKDVGGVQTILGRHINLKIEKTTVSDMVTLLNLPLYFKRGISSTFWYLKKCQEYGILKKSSEGYVIHLKGSDHNIGKTNKTIRKWIIEEQPALWKKIVACIDSKEEEKFLNRCKEDPTANDMEFKV